jgi:hypothetical protein
MAVAAGPDIVNDGLVLHLDAANSRSYPGTGTVWNDLSGNGNDGTLVNGVGYNTDNNGSMVFDGIDDFSRPTISYSYLNSSALGVLFKSSNHGTGFKTIFGYRHNGGFSLPTIGSIYLNGSTLSASVITASQVYRTATFSFPIQMNTTYFAILNKDTINGTLQLFVNSMAGNIQTFDTSTYAQWTTVGSFVGANILDIGKSTNTSSGQGWSSDYFSGNIYKLFVYNHILTPAEIRQNFEALRGRYGI